MVGGWEAAAPRGHLLEPLLPKREVMYCACVRDNSLAGCSATELNVNPSILNFIQHQCL